MSTPLNQPTREPILQVAHALCKRINHYFQHQAPHEQNISIRVEANDVPATAEGRVQRSELVFILANGKRLQGSLLTRFLGGNMFEVDASVAERMKRFTLCLPQPTTTREDGSGARICEYLFDEVKRAAGELYLKEISKTCRPGWELS